MSNENLHERESEEEVRRGRRMLMLPLPRRVSVFVASFNLLPSSVSDILFTGDKPERGRCNYKKEGNDERYDKMTEGWAWVCNLTRHCHPTGITPAMIDIFWSDSPSNTIVSLARFRLTAWNYLRSDAPHRFNMLVLSGRLAKLSTTLNNMGDMYDNVATFL